MATNLNLLPPELAVDPKMAKVFKAAKALGLISVAFFVVFCMGAIGFFIISNISLNNSKNEVESLKTKVKALEASEQKMVLLKDRLKKISVVLNKPSTSKNLILVEPFLTSTDSNVSIVGLELNSAKITLNIGFKSNASMTDFFKNLQESTDFKNVTLSTFGYNPSTGYLATFTMVGK